MEEGVRVQIIHAKFGLINGNFQRDSHLCCSSRKKGRKIDHSLFRDLDLMKALIPFFFAYCGFCGLERIARNEHLEFDFEVQQRLTIGRRKNDAATEFKGPQERFRAGQRFYSRLPIANYERGSTQCPDSEAQWVASRKYDLNGLMQYDIRVRSKNA